MKTLLNERKNLAYRRAAYQSSSYTVNETAQLVTVGVEPIDESKMAYEFLHKDGNQSRYGNVKYLFDYGNNTEFQTYTTSTYVQVRLPRKTMIYSYALTAGSSCNGTSPYPSVWSLQGSMDAIVFEEFDRREGIEFTEYETKEFKVTQPVKAYTTYRLIIESVYSGDRIHLGKWFLFDNKKENILASYDENVLSYVSAWMSNGNKEEWIYVDLGEECIFDQVKIYWGSMFATKYEIQVSNDAHSFYTVAVDENGCGDEKDIIFDSQRARYVRLFLKETNPENIAYIVREFEVYGINYLIDKVSDLSKCEQRIEKKEKECEKQFLNTNWKVERANSLLPESLENGLLSESISNDTGVSQLIANKNMDSETEDLSSLGNKIATKEYNDSAWLPAIVPGTVFLSYIKAGAVANPIYADWQRCASNSYFKSDFWYRTTFFIAKDKKGQTIWLNFDAINWKAKVFLNGKFLGQIGGGFIRGQFDITSFVNYEKENYLAVLIIKNTDPGTAYTSNDNGPGTMGGVFGNDGRIGEDAPTYSAANGWDWVPTVRGRNIGIYNDVYLTYTSDVKLIDPFVVTTFHRKEDGTFDLSKANVTIKTEIKNSSNAIVTGNVHADIRGDSDQELQFNKPYHLEAYETSVVEIGPITIHNPKVWWPNGYGEQSLYKLDIKAFIDQNIPYSDRKELKFGIREFTYQFDESNEVDCNGYQNGNNLAILCNGVRIIIRGGNWGLEDINLDVDKEKYDDKIRLHKYENFNIIRNWGGQVNDPELYHACDKYGIIIWDDFFFPGCWLHSPKDSEMFLENVKDKIKHYRYHACLALYCGANEMHPEVFIIEKGMRDYVATLDGTRHYIPNSAKAPVAEDGPHKAMLPEFYFKNTLPNIMNSERGMPNIPVAETMKLIFPKEKLWPPNEMWALHDFAMRWNVDGAGYLKKLEDYGEFDTFDEMIQRAQMQSYELHKAMFEGSIAAGSNGLMMWMSNPAWPSLVWQSYDYFHDVNGGYFGIKTACQPINLIFNPATNQMILFNGTINGEELTAELMIYDLSGVKIDEMCITTFIESDTLIPVFDLDFTKYESDLVFLKVKVYYQDKTIAGENFYWHNHKNPRDFRALSELPKIPVTVDVEKVDSLQNIVDKEDVEDKEDIDLELNYIVKVTNEANVPALLIRLKVLNTETKGRVLPVFYEDNYFSLMPNEVKCVKICFKEKNFSGTARIVAEGFHVLESYHKKD